MFEKCCIGIENEAHKSSAFKGHTYWHICVLLYIQRTTFEANWDGEKDKHTLYLRLS